MKSDINDVIKLTGREMEILLLISRGLTTKEICQKLFVSQTTILTHRKNLRKKLQATNSVELLNNAVKNGVLR